MSQHGRPDDGTDDAGFLDAELFASLEPVTQWPTGEDKDALTAKHKPPSGRRVTPGALLPNSTPMVLRAPGQEPSPSYSGLSDEADNQWKQIVDAALLSALQAIGRDVNTGANGDARYHLWVAWQ